MTLPLISHKIVFCIITMKIIRLLLLLNFLPCILFAFNKRADSFKPHISATETSIANINTILNFCEENRSYSYDTLSRYAGLALSLARQSGNKELIVKASYYFALDNYRKNNLDTVLEIIDLALTAAANKTSYALLRNRFKLLKASTYLKQNKHQAAVDMFYQVIADAEKSGDTFSLVRGLNGQGWVLMELGQFEAAKRWFHKGIIAAHSPDVLEKASILYTNLASCCGALVQLDSAKYYVEKGLAMARSYEDLPAQANSLNILASYYIERKEYDEALANIRESTEIRKIIGDPFFIISDMGQLSYLLSKTGKADQALTIVKKAIEYATQYKIESKLPLLYLVLSQNLYDAKDFKSSADALFTLQKLQDSLYRKASASALAEMQVKYETTQKEKTIQKQQYELSRKNYLLYGSMALIILVILLAWAVMRNRRHKQEVKMQKVILQQQALAAQSIVVAEENERKRIASDLHDGLGQMLTAARFNLSGISDSINSIPEPDKKIFEKAVKLLDESCVEVRNVSHSIMPNALINSGLDNALKDFIEKIKGNRLQVTLSTSGLNETSDANTEIMIYRIVQECVNNTLKHSGATKLDISLINDDDGLNLTIEDNGKGFDITKLPSKKGIGMKNIRSRTQYLKGSIDIDSRPGHGTLIAIHIPAKNQKT
jgi:two-component system, NarL family, sensor kinase